MEHPLVLSSPLASVDGFLVRAVLLIFYSFFELMLLGHFLQLALLEGRVMVEHCFLVIVYVIGHVAVSGILVVRVGISLLHVLRPLRHQVSSSGLVCEVGELGILLLEARVECSCCLKLVFEKLVLELLVFKLQPVKLFLLLLSRLDLLAMRLVGLVFFLSLLFGQLVEILDCLIFENQSLLLN